jgi:hypothetical protein
MQPKNIRVRDMLAPLRTRGQLMLPQHLAGVLIVRPDFMIGRHGSEDQPARSSLH